MQNSCLEVGSHDPIFSSNCSSAHFLRQQLDVWTPIFDKFPTFFYVLDENRTCSISIRLDQKSRQEWGWAQKRSKDTYENNKNKTRWNFIFHSVLFI